MKLYRFLCIILFLLISSGCDATQEKEPYKSQYGAIALQAARVDGDQVHLKSEKTFFLYEDHAHEEAHVKSISDLARLAEKNHILLSYKTLEGEVKVTPLKNLAIQNAMITASVTKEASSFFKALSSKAPPQLSRVSCIYLSQGGQRI